jgi:iron complex transport system permease protein
VLAACGLFCLHVLLGPTSLSIANIVNPESVDAHVFWQLRMPRALTAFIAGAGLAVCGLIFQALFLNPLATPYTLGVSSGASLGAAIIIALSQGLPWLSSQWVTLGALIGSSLSVFLVLIVSRGPLGRQRHVMLLMGVAISFFFSSLLLLVQFLASFYEAFRIIRWLMGGIGSVTWSDLWITAPVVALGLILLFRHHTHLDLMGYGDDVAHTRGLSVTKTRRRLVLITSVIVAMIVSVTGPIGFIGLIVPHFGRLFVGARHLPLLLWCVFVGGSVLLFCDWLARLVLAPAELPVGILTALIGAPFFLMMISSRQMSGQPGRT